VIHKKVVAMLKRQGADPCWQDWLHWYQTGRLGELRPACAPATIYEEWWEARDRALKL
jgi:hypothetical protein